MLVVERQLTPKQLISDMKSLIYTPVSNARREALYLTFSETKLEASRGPAAAFFCGCLTNRLDDKVYIV